MPSAPEFAHVKAIALEQNVLEASGLNFDLNTPNLANQTETPDKDKIIQELQMQLEMLTRQMTTSLPIRNRPGNDMYTASTSGLSLSHNSPVVSRNLQRPASSHLSSPEFQRPVETIRSPSLM